MPFGFLFFAILSRFQSACILAGYYFNNTTNLQIHFSHKQNIEIKQNTKRTKHRNGCKNIDTRLDGRRQRRLIQKLWAQFESAEPDASASVS